MNPNNPDIDDLLKSFKNGKRKHNEIVRLISSKVTSVRFSKAANAFAARVETISPLNPSICNKLQICEIFN